MTRTGVCLSDAGLLEGVRLSVWDRVGVSCSRFVTSRDSRFLLAVLSLSQTHGDGDSTETSNTLPLDSGCRPCVFRPTRASRAYRHKPGAGGQDLQYGIVWGVCNK